MPIFNEIKIYKERTIARDLTIGLIVSVGFAVSILGIIYYINFATISQKELNKRATNITKEFINVVEFHLWEMRYNVVKQISRGYLQSDYLVGIRVELENGEVIFDNVSIDTSGLIHKAEKLVHDDLFIGVVNLYFSTKNVDKNRWKVITSIFFTGMAVLGIIMVGMHLLLRFLLSAPLNQLIQRIRTIAEGDYKTLLKPVPQYNINAIINEINDMAYRIADRTEQLESEIIQRKNLQAESLRNARLASLGELAAGVAHEINNPINGVINYAQILIDQNQGRVQDIEIYEKIIKESDRIEKIVTNLLSFARRQKDGKRSVQIITILSNTMELMRSQLRSDNIKITINVPDDLPIIHANAQQIQQVFLNIISNSKDAMNEKYTRATKDKNLTIDCHPIDIKGSPFVQISFIDSGSGIDPEIIDRIFDPFFSTKAPGIGTGLGLSISYGIIDDHKGRFHFESEPGTYTKAMIEFPVNQEANVNGK